MNQRELFGGNTDEVARLAARRRSRATDPPTSHAGEEHILTRVGRIQAEVLAHADDHPRTARELAERACCGGEVESYRKRVRELVGLGRLVERPARTCQHTGRKAATFVRVS